MQSQGFRFISTALLILFASAHTKGSFVETEKFSDYSGFTSGAPSDYAPQATTSTQETTTDSPSLTRSLKVTPPSLNNPNSTPRKKCHSRHNKNSLAQGTVQPLPVTTYPSTTSRKKCHSKPTTTESPATPKLIKKCRKQQDSAHPTQELEYSDISETEFSGIIKQMQEENPVQPNAQENEHLSTQLTDAHTNLDSELVQFKPEFYRLAQGVSQVSSTEINPNAPIHSDDDNSNEDTSQDESAWSQLENSENDIDPLELDNDHNDDTAQRTKCYGNGCPPHLISIINP
jgi:hypothetical protein